MNKSKLILLFLSFFLLSCSNTNVDESNNSNSNPSTSESISPSESETPSEDPSEEPSEEESESLEETESNIPSESESEEPSEEEPSELESESEENSELEPLPFELNRYEENPTSEPEINKILSTINPVGNLYDVWDYYRGDDVTVAVIDSGFDINHPEFFDKDGNSTISDKSAYISSTNTGSITTKVGKNNVNITDGDSHGTMCAGVLASSVNNKGITGIAPNVDLMLIKVDKKAYSIAEAFKYAADNGAKVVSISLGQYPNPYGETSGDVIYQAGLDISTIFNENINYAHEKGVTIISAAGNSKTTQLSYPAGCPNVIGVGGLNGGSQTQMWDEGHEGSNYNGATTYVDVFAPSSLIYAPGYDTSTNKSTYWSSGKGTSFAAPIVAGAAALYFDKYPQHTNIDFENALKRSSQNISSYNGNKNMGYGRLDIANLLNIEEDIKEITYTPSTTISENITKLTIIDEAGWNFRTLHLFDLKFKSGYGLTDFENFLNNHYGNRILTKNYQLEGTTKGWGYTDENYTGDYYLNIGNTDHAKPTNYEYVFPSFVTGFKYQIVNNQNWLPEGGHQISINDGYLVDVNTYFWFKGDNDTGTSQVVTTNKSKYTFPATTLSIVSNSNTITETYNVYTYLERNPNYYFTSDYSYSQTRILMNKDLKVYKK